MREVTVVTVVTIGTVVTVLIVVTVVTTEFVQLFFWVTNIFVNHNYCFSFVTVLTTEFFQLFFGSQIFFLTTIIVLALYTVSFCPKNQTLTL